MKTCSRTATRIARVRVIRNGELWYKWKNLMLPGLNMEDTVSLPPRIGFRWLGRDRDGCEGKERLFD